MKKLTVLIVAFLAVPVLSGSLFAGEGQSPEAAMSGQMEEMQQAIGSISAEEIVGLKVFSQTGEELGKIKAANIDSQTGQVHYINLSRKGAFGGIMTGGSAAIPIEALQVDLEAGEATLTVDQGKLDNVPEQAGMSVGDYTKELQSHYGVSPAWPAQELEQVPMQAPEIPESVPELMPESETEKKY